MKLSVLIPVYNEKNTINLILQKVLDTKLNYELKKEIIIVDDFSNDGTREILKGLDLSSNENIKILFHDINTGKGSAVQTGLKAVTGEFTIIQDADLEYDPNDYNKLLHPIINNGADVVYGSRFVGAGSTRVLFFWHRIANGILTLLSNMKSNLNLTDMECGYKIFKTSAITSIQLNEKRFGFEPEVTLKLAKQGFSFYEVGISYHGRNYDQGKKIGIKDAFAALYCILRY